MTDKWSQIWTQEEAKLDALQRHPDCKHAEVKNGLAFPMTLTWVVELWRNDECWYNGDPPRYVEQSYPSR
jgi:hypothetical protein